MQVDQAYEMITAAEAADIVTDALTGVRQVSSNRLDDAGDDPAEAASLGDELQESLDHDDQRRTVA